MINALTEASSLQSLENCIMSNFLSEIPGKGGENMSEEIMVEPLSATEKKLLKSCETKIQNGQKSQAEMGKALLTIRDAKLYRENHSTFEDYCLRQWEFTDARANQLIAMYRVTTVVVDVRNEAQARELAPLLAKPDELLAVWQEANEVTGNNPTAKVIAQIRAERLEALRKNGKPKQEPESFWERTRTDTDAVVAETQQNSLNGWISRIADGAGWAIKEVEGRGVHPAITSTQRDQWLEKLREVRKVSGQLIRIIERSPTPEGELETEIKK